jgi:hypothetical protein
MYIWLVQGKHNIIRAQGSIDNGETSTTHVEDAVQGAAPAFSHRYTLLQCSSSQHFSSLPEIFRASDNVTI